MWVIIIKKINFNKKYLTISLYVLAVIILAIISFRIINNAGFIGESIITFFSAAASLFAVFIFGFFIAYFLNPMVRFFEKKIFGRIKQLASRAKALRILSIVTVYVLMISLLFWITAYVFPELVSSFQGLVVMIRMAVDSFYRLGFADIGENEVLNSVIRSFNGVFGTSYSVRDIIEQALTPVMGILEAIPGFMASLYDNLLSIMQNVFNFIVGMIIAFYMLYEKENIGRILQRFMGAFLKDQTSESIISVSKRANRIVEGFTVGKIVDSAIMGVLFFLVGLVMRLPFLALLTLIFAITNIVPYFGPIVGGIICGLVVMFQNPLLGLWTGVACLVLQQIDGNIIGPKILGSSTGLKPLSVIFAILVGGALFGVFGMFFGTPVFAVILSLFNNYIDKRREAKGLKAKTLSVPEDLR